MKPLSNLKNENQSPFPEVMVPLIGSVEEFTNQKKIINDMAETVKKEQGVQFTYLVGTMIELPRACATADQIAEEAQFFSFGTNVVPGKSKSGLGEVIGAE